jgi:hypothetical protein
LDVGENEIVAVNTPPKHWFLHRIGHQPRQNDRNKQQPTFHLIQVATKEQRLEPMAGCGLSNSGK